MHTFFTKGCDTGGVHILFTASLPRGGGISNGGVPSPAQGDHTREKGIARECDGWMKERTFLPRIAGGTRDGPIPGWRTNIGYGRVCSPNRLSQGALVCRSTIDASSFGHAIRR